MVWVIFALGAALCAAGGAAILSGLSYMPIEWGWSQLIAGTTAVSAGIVTLALGALLFRLGSIHRTLREVGPRRDGTMAAPPQSETSPEPEPLPLPAAVRPEPEPVRSEGADESSRPVDTDRASEPVGPRSDAPDPAGEVPPEASESEQPSPTGPRREIQPEEAPPVRIVEREARPKPTGWAGRLAARRAGRGDPPPPPQESPDLAPPPWALDEPENEPRTSPIPGAQASRAGRDGDPERQGPDVSVSNATAPVSRSPANGAALAEATPDAIVTEAAAETVPPTIVGRYQAGGASYALFSDGTIEVETETGTHRFGSMDDLKQFLERQDETNRPGWPG